MFYYVIIMYDISVELIHFFANIHYLNRKIKNKYCNQNREYIK